MGRVLAVSVLALGCVYGTASPSRQTATPRTAAQICRGSALDLDAAATVCTVHEAPRPVPVTALRVEIVPSEIELESGHEIAISVQMTNTTIRPLTFDLVLGCDSFEVSAYAENAQTRVDLSEKSECPREIPADVPEDVVCSPGDPVRVTLEPGGRLVKHVLVAAHSHGFAKWRGGCVRETGTAFEPGRYVARVRLPFPAQPVPGPSSAPPSPSVEAPVIVTPVRMFPQATAP